MAQSKLFMTINYAIMVEVQKTLPGYRFKLQYDSRALTTDQADMALELFDAILETMGGAKGGKVRDLMALPSSLDGMWRL